jgi:4-hydroxy-tetrahydrodipicolinate reductase
MIGWSQISREGGYMERIKVCVAGATGWTGSAVTQGVIGAADMELVGAVARKAAGEKIENVTVVPTVEEALNVPVDVLIDYTSPGVVRKHIDFAVGRGVGVVVGTSGLTARDYKEIDNLAKEAKIGVIAAGNFSVTAALLQVFAVMAARVIPQWEIIDYAWPTKPDAPGGTARELAEKLGAVRKPGIGCPIEKIYGQKEARGANVEGTQVHSVRLPGYKFNVEVIFGLEGERLSIRADTLESAQPYVAGTLFAVRKVLSVVGVVRDLSSSILEKSGD